MKTSAEILKSKLSRQTEKKLEKLSPERRKRVEKIVQQHVAACLKIGSPPENLDRVCTEAIEAVHLEDLHPEPPLTKEERRLQCLRPYRYEVYQSPKIPKGESLYIK